MQRHCIAVQLCPLTAHCMGHRCHAHPHDAKFLRRHTLEIATCPSQLRHSVIIMQGPKPEPRAPRSGRGLWLWRQRGGSRSHAVRRTHHISGLHCHHHLRRTPVQLLPKRRQQRWRRQCGLGCVCRPWGVLAGHTLNRNRDCQRRRRYQCCGCPWLRTASGRRVCRRAAARVRRRTQDTRHRHQRRVSWWYWCRCRWRWRWWP